ncbi:MAG TPA: Imm26 family immunity protein [Bacteroidia bacterium]|nr:Imm26 family immunity protein [Bacteroidia bacterium]
MKAEFSGNIYRFPLDFGMGYGYAELDDFSDVYSFDGILVTVFKLIDKEDKEHTIDEIRSSGILFGPVPIFRYPPKRGPLKWRLIGKNPDYLIKEWPVFKYYQKLLKSKDWSRADYWMKRDRKSDTISGVIEYVSYEIVRYLETTILNAAEGVASKITMMQIIANREEVSGYYDLNLLENRNLYAQLVNTYYDKETAARLLEEIEDLL